MGTGSRRWKGGSGVAAVLAMLALGACASSGGDENPQYTSRSEPINQDASERIDLIALIDPEERRLAIGSEVCERAEKAFATARGDALDRAMAQRVECAFLAFKSYAVSSQELRRDGMGGGDAVYARAGTSLALAVRRNEIQDRLMLRSDALCRDFTRRLNINLRIDNDTDLVNFVRNTQSRLVAGVGSLVLGGDVLWVLTNASRITDLPTYTEDEGQIEENLVRIAIIGIREQREELFALIDGKRRLGVAEGGLRVRGPGSDEGLTPITTYSLERAIGDALSYHAACSVNVGLGRAHRLIIDTQTDRTVFPPLLPSEDP